MRQFLSKLFLLLLPVFLAGACDNKTAAAPKIVYPGFFDQLPKDPGEAGKATLTGVDADANGVRDDVQIAIARKYPYEPEVRAALVQLATSVQSAITAQTDEDIARAAGLLAFAVDCIYEYSTSAREDVKEFERLMVNTSARSTAYIGANQKASGQFYGGNDNFADGCDPALLEVQTKLQNQ